MSVKINIEGEGLSYQKDTTIIKASQIIAFLNADINGMSEEVANLTSNTMQIAPSYAGKSPRDAILESFAKTNAQKILVFAKYDADKNKQLAFGVSDIKMYFKKAGEPEPKNFARDVREAIKQNFIYEEDEGQYVITDYGNSLLQMGFESSKQSSPRNKRKSSTSRNGKKRPANTVSESVSNIAILPKTEDTIPYHSVVKKGDRILWILYYFHKNTIDEMTSAEIEYVANRLVDKIPAGSLSALTETSRKLGYLTKNNEGKYKILYDGIEYLSKLNSLNSDESRIQEDEGK